MKRGVSCKLDFLFATRMLSSFGLLLVAAVIPTFEALVPATASPVIGILSQPLPITSSNEDDEKFYIAASYPKWLESAGARTIVVPHDADDALVDEIFSQVNGFLWTGGANNPVPNAARRMWHLVKQANLEQNDFFPLWGTCLGYEYLLMVQSEIGDDILESGFDSHNISWPLYGVRPVGLYSDPTIYNTVVNRNVTLNNHEYGVSPARFLADRNLTALFQITSVNVDATGRPFVSTMEPWDPAQFPVYGVQYHPEKNMFEYATYPGTNIPFEAIDHSPEGIAFSFYLAQFFVALARRNLGQGKHQYTQPDRFPVIGTFPMKSGVYFEQYYVFPATVPPPTTITNPQQQQQVNVKGI